MFPITLTITVQGIAQLHALANLFDTPLPGTPLPTIEKDAAAQVEKPSGAKTARGPRTAEAAAADAPAKTGSASAQSAASAAAEPQASTAAAEAFKYETLQKKVFELLPTHGQALLKIAKKHGAEKFKELPADKWEAAYNDLVAEFEAA